MNILCFGISHQTANVEVRERFAIPDSALADSLTRLARVPNVLDARISEGGCYFWSIVWGAVIHDEQLKICIGLVQDGGDTLR